MTPLGGGSIVVEPPESLLLMILILPDVCSWIVVLPVYVYAPATV